MVAPALHIVQSDPESAPENSRSLAKRRAPELVEREAICEQLRNAVLDAVSGTGSCVLIGGEAGVGKTSVLLWLEAVIAAEARVLWGSCEALHTPRPMGPLHDMAPELGEPLAKLLRAESTPVAVFDTLVASLRAAARPTVLIFEDVHWADHGTHDLIRFLGRRVHRQNVVLILSYRQDEVVAHHPLSAVIGDLPAQSTLRINLLPLSAAGVATLAAPKGVDEKKLHAITGGNPLFVTELLANLEAGQEMRVSNSIRDAVLARISRLDESARTVLDLASVVPGKIDRALLFDLAGKDADAAVADCLQRGLLVEVDEGSAFMFRHELARLAIEAALSPGASKAWHKRVIAAQIDRPGVSAARLVHHALALNDEHWVLELAPRAALEAARLGAHREAAAHFATALRVAGKAPDEVRAQLHESWSYEAGLVRIDDNTIAARHQALALWRKLGNHEKVGLNLRWLSRLVWYQGDGAAAERFLDEAIAALQNAPPCAEQAWACSVRSQMYMLNSKVDEAVEWGERALLLADEHKVAEVRVHALNNIGSALMFAQRPGGLERMEESLRLALAGGFHEQAARVYTNVASFGERFREFAVTEKYAVDGLEFDRRHDLDSWTHYLEGTYAKMLLHQGRFEEAEKLARQVLATPHLTTVMRFPALGVLAHVRMRQGHADGPLQLQEGLQKALPTRELQRVAPFAVALAESAWLRDDIDGVRRALASLDGLAGLETNPWDYGDCVIWRHRIGDDLRAIADQVSPPYAAEIRGDHALAAALWRNIGDPYSAAMALAQGLGANTDSSAASSVDSGALAQWQEAIDIFVQLGAEPAARKLRNRARALGLRGIRRGPYAAARRNVYGITSKELDVLRLMMDGKTNLEISSELSRSSKTVDHHVSSLLAKLGAKNRTEAASIAIRENLFAEDKPA